MDGASKKPVRSLKNSWIYRLLFGKSYALLKLF